MESKNLGFIACKMVNVTRLVTHPLRHIIRLTNLQNVRIDDSLAIYRLKLSSDVGG